MKVCVVGSGGREHALALALAKSADVVATPGNPGIVGTTSEGHTLASTAAPAEEIAADLYVIGPEAPLVDGLADRLRGHGRLVFGPGADGARLEGSKAWMKEVLARAGIPTAAHATFDTPEPALAYLRTRTGPPYVVKTDGLAAGKGVLVTSSLAEAEDDVVAKLSGTSFGAAGRRVVIEEGLAGSELSVLAVCDGKRAIPLAPARDYKRVGDGDSGPNTGGMGAFSPVPLADGALVGRVMDEIVDPLVAALRSDGIDYRGVLYAGLMVTGNGPKVIEFNVRLGDPEAQVVLPRYGGDLAVLLASAAAGRLPADVPPPRPTAAVCVVLAAEGYPGTPRTGDVIDGLDAAGQVDGVQVIHAGTAHAGGHVVTAGGRILGITAEGADLADARERAYTAAARVSWPGVHYRRDVALVAVDPAGTAGAKRP